MTAMRWAAPLAVFAAGLAVTAFLFIQAGEDAGARRHGSASPFLEALPDLPMGRQNVSLSVRNSPGYRPPADPESLAERRGRREVGPVGEELLFAYPSAESLAAEIVRVTARRDAAALKRLHILREEFDAILWPEFPESRPFANTSADDAWFFHMGHSQGGMSKGLGEYGGTDLRFTRLEARGVLRYANFKLVEDVVIHARDGAGRDVALDFAEAFVERNGRWKVYIFKD